MSAVIFHPAPMVAIKAAIGISQIFFLSRKARFKSATAITPVPKLNVSV